MTALCCRSQANQTTFSVVQNDLLRYTRRRNGQKRLVPKSCFAVLSCVTHPHGRMNKYSRGRKYVRGQIIAATSQGPESETMILNPWYEEETDRSTCEMALEAPWNCFRVCWHVLRPLLLLRKALCSSSHPHKTHPASLPPPITSLSSIWLRWLRVLLHSHPLHVPWFMFPPSAQRHVAECDMVEVEVSGWRVKGEDLSERWREGKEWHFFFFFFFKGCQTCVYTFCPLSP